jgi:hypothetical protein
MSPVRYELTFNIPKDDILHSHRRENLKCYTGLLLWKLIVAQPSVETSDVTSYEFGIILLLSLSLGGGNTQPKAGETPLTEGGLQWRGENLVDAVCCASPLYLSND